MVDRSISPQYRPKVRRDSRCASMPLSTGWVKLPPLGSISTGWPFGLGVSPPLTPAVRPSLVTRSGIGAAFSLPSSKVATAGDLANL